MPDYSKSKIYKIVCNETGETYYGSTTQMLSQRLSEHRIKAKKNYKIKSTSIINRGNYDIVLCEECPCENKEQLHAIERKWIENNECVNKQIPTRTLTEYYVENSEKIKTQSAEYRVKNAEKLRAYRAKNVEKIREYRAKYDAKIKAQKENFDNSH